MIGHDHDRDFARRFRLDRVTAAVPLPDARAVPWLVRAPHSVGEWEPDQAHDILIGEGTAPCPDEVLTKGDLSQALTFARVACNQLIQAQVARGLEEHGCLDET